MDKLKRKIIRYFVLCAFGMSVAEAVLDSLFTDWILPQFTGNRPVVLFMMCVYLFLTFAVFALFAVFFWKLTGGALNTESKRQVRERNTQYSRICHDLKTPLTSIQGFAAALRDGKIKPEERQEIYGIIYSKSCYVNELVESMFAYSKLEMDDFRLSFKRLDLCALVRGVVALIYDEFESRGMELQLDIPDEPLYCSLDEKEMKRSIGNLLVNAYKHNPNGTKVLVRVYRRGRDAYVSVADDGVAIAAEQAECIFDPFACGDEARSGGSGNGLGLTIAGIIVQNHGGNLYLQNAIDGYTKAFVFQIPSEG
ncbi:MAG: sensor histidine kinase [Christensenellales bacterium]|jgi:signal transduction histidine kinase